MEAIRMFSESESPYDLILMDLHMPDMDGCETSINIRLLEDEGAERVPILALTAEVFEKDVARCRQSGMNGHIRKPVTAERLYERLIAFFAMNRTTVGKDNAGGGALSGVWIDDAAKDKGRSGAIRVDRGRSDAIRADRGRSDTVNTRGDYKSSGAAVSRFENQSDSSIIIQSGDRTGGHSGSQTVSQSHNRINNQSDNKSVKLTGSQSDKLTGGQSDKITGVPTDVRTNLPAGVPTDSLTGVPTDVRTGEYSGFYPVFDVTAALKNLKNIKKLYIAMLVSLKSNPLFDEIRLALEKNDYSLIGSSAAALKNVAEKMCLPDMLATLGEIDAMARHKLQRPELAHMFAQSSERIFDRLDALIETLNQEANS
jgi:CheY-like chemotaxis protein